MMHKKGFSAPYWLTDSCETLSLDLLLIAQKDICIYAEIAKDYLSHLGHASDFHCRKITANTHLYLSSYQAWRLWQELLMDSQHLPCDIFIQPVNKRTIKLLVCDMDSTIIRGESLDDLAELVGVGQQVAAITEKTMRGEMDFHQAINDRVALLSGVSTSIFKQLRSRITYNSGAEQLIRRAREKEIRCILISGGFEQVVAHVSNQLGFDDYVCNRLQTSHGKLTGYVQEPIIDSAAKRNLLLEQCQKMGIDRQQVCAIGDGANDLPMLNTAGLGVGYCAKPVVRSAILCQINNNPLDAITFLL